MCKCLVSEFCCGCCNMVGTDRGHSRSMLSTHSMRSVSISPSSFSVSLCMSQDSRSKHP